MFTGFLIHYQQSVCDKSDPPVCRTHDKALIRNTIDRCVFRQSWNDGITTARVGTVQITNNVVHRTLGHGINVGEEFVGFGKDRRSRRAEALQRPVPPGDDHTIDNNLVSDSFKRRMIDGAPRWLSGMMMRQTMASFKGNVVSGSYWAGITIRTQDEPNAVTHTIENNEAYNNKYGVIIRNGHHVKPMEFYDFKGWANWRGGVLGFDEATTLTLKKNVLASARRCVRAWSTLCGYVRCQIDDVLHTFVWL